MTVGGCPSQGEALWSWTPRSGKEGPALSQRGRRKSGISDALSWCVMGHHMVVTGSARGLRQQLLPRKLFNQTCCMLSRFKEAQLK